VPDEPAHSTEETHSAATDPEDRQCPHPDAHTSPVVVEETGGECNVGADIENPPKRDDAAADAEGTHSAATVPDGGDPSHAAEMHTSLKVEHDGTGKLKAGDEAPLEAVADEDATPAHGVGVLLPCSQKVTWLGTTPNQVRDMEDVGLPTWRNVSSNRKEGGRSRQCEYHRIDPRQVDVMLANMDEEGVCSGETLSGS